MSEHSLEVRSGGPGVAVIDITGEITASTQQPLDAAYRQADDMGPRMVVLNFAGLEYMNSGGIGLLVTMLIRARRRDQRLVAVGLSDHYRQIFSVTRLDEAIGIYDNEQEAVSASQTGG